MIITINWLREFLDTEEQLASILEKLTSSGIEVEGYHACGENLESFVLCNILHSEKHPNADQLSICKVDVGGTAPMQVVCGAKNANAGHIMVFAPIGSIVPASGMVIKQVKIRGVESCGMLCSMSELGLRPNLLPMAQKDGILELPNYCKPGAKLIEYL